MRQCVLNSMFVYSFPRYLVRNVPFLSIIVLSCVACLVLSYFLDYLTNFTIIGKKLSKKECVL